MSELRVLRDKSWLFRLLRRRPSPLGDRAGSTFVKMVELAGLEPATSWVRSNSAYPVMELFFPANERYMGLMTMLVNRLI